MTGSASKWQAILSNYAKAAHELDTPKALQDDLKDCRCSSCLFKPNADCLNEHGHVNTIDTKNLKWPYLRTIAERGRKFRLQGDID